MSTSGLVAIDVGSSRVKLGWFPPAGECTSEKQLSFLPIAASPLAQPADTLAVAHDDSARLQQEIHDWLAEIDAAEARFLAASVHPEALASVQACFDRSLETLTFEQLPLEIRVEQPERVGIDRLLSAVAVNRLRQPRQAAIVVDSGTACTVDLVAADGAFEGGAILPGIGLSAAALHRGTAALPQLSIDTIGDATPVVGKSTQAAITSGLHWGFVGAVQGIVDRIAAECSARPPLFLTGGGAPRLMALLSSEQQVRHLPSLILSGIALVAEELS